MLATIGLGAGLTTFGTVIYYGRKYLQGDVNNSVNLQENTSASNVRPSEDSQSSSSSTSSSTSCTTSCTTSTSSSSTSTGTTHESTPQELYAKMLIEMQNNPKFTRLPDSPQKLENIL